MSDKAPLEIEIEMRLEALRAQKKTQQEKAKDLELEIQATHRQLRDEWNRKACLDISNLKAVLSERHGISETDPKFKKAFEIAWGRGHAGGLDDVAYNFNELAELLK